MLKTLPNLPIIELLSGGSCKEKKLTNWIEMKFIEGQRHHMKYKDCLASRTQERLQDPSSAEDPYRPPLLIGFCHHHMSPNAYSQNKQLSLSETRS